MNASACLNEISFPELQALLPALARMAEAASRQTETLIASTEADDDGLAEGIEQLVQRWVGSVALLGGRAVGLWVARFENAEGCWTWSADEPHLLRHHADAPWGDARGTPVQ